MVVRNFQVVVDCRDPDRLAEFWAVALGYQVETPPGDSGDWMAFQIERGFPDEERVAFAAVREPGGSGRLCFLGVPESKAGKNRLHLDIDAAEPADTREVKIAKVDELVARLVELGARVLRTGRERGQYFVTLADVEGNELCVH